MPNGEAPLRPGALKEVARFAFPLLVYAILVLLAGLLRGPWLPALFLFIGLAQYRLYFPLHEASHRLLFPDPGWNDLAGRFLAALLFTSFNFFRREHLAHHRDFGLPADPGAPDYQVTIRTRRALVLFLLAPLMGVTVLNKLHALLRGQPAAGARPTALLAELLPMAACQLAIFLIVSVPHQSFWRYPVLIVAPFITIFLFLSRLRMFLEHGALGLAPDGRIARTFEASGWDSWLLSGWNFQFHHEHHLHPGLPSFILPASHAELAGTVPATETATSYRSALAGYWRRLG